MNRVFFSVLALVIAVGVSVAAVVELDRRSDEDRLALEPTIRPSPFSAASPMRSPRGVEATPRATEEAAAPRSTVRRTAERTVAPEPTETVEPPRTPTPEPDVTIGPIDPSQRQTPRTGGGAVLNGILIALGALVARAILVVRARSSTG